MEEKKKEIYKLIFLVISTVVLIIFIVFTESFKANKDNKVLKNNTNSNTHINNNIDINNLYEIPGYNNLYQYEIDLETY